MGNRYTGPVAVQFSGLKATLSNAAYAPLCQVGAERLVFEPGQSRRFEFRFASDAQDIGGELQVPARIPSSSLTALVSIFPLVSRPSENDRFLYLRSSTNAEFVLAHNCCVD